MRFRVLGDLAHDSRNARTSIVDLAFGVVVLGVRLQGIELHVFVCVVQAFGFPSEGFQL